MLRKSLFYLYYIREARLQYINFIREYFFIKKNLYNSIERNVSIQKKRLFKILNHSIQKVPYYKRIAHQKNIEISEDTIFEDIKKFPILTKEHLRNNWNSLHVNLKNIRYSINTSGGTTGEPVKFIQSRKLRILNFCGKTIFNEIGDYNVGDKLVKLWGNESDLLKLSESRVQAFITKYFRNIIFQNSFKMTANTIYRHIQEINLKKPKVMLAYIQSIYEMTKFIRRHNLDIHKLKSIITSAGVLTEEVKEFIEDVFNTKVYNRYGTREVSVIGSSCEKSSKIHLNMYQKYIEILDDNDKSLPENEKGNIIITDLINYTMPLIRYKIGDFGSINYSPCSCERGLVRLNNVQGRIIDFFKNEAGELIYGDFFTHLFYFKENVKQFQVYQKTVNLIDISIVTLNKKPLSSSIEEDLKNKMLMVMGDNCIINFKYVDYINPSFSGKYRYTISDLWK